MAGAPEFEFSPEPAPELQAIPAPDFEFGNLPPEPTAAATYRAITPKRIGEFLSQVPERLEQTQQQAQDEALSREAGARMELGPSSEGFQKALAGFGSGLDIATGGVFPYLPALGAKGLGKLGVSGYERYADMPLVEAKKEAERKVRAASALQPGSALTGQAAGLVGGAAMLPAVAPSAGPAVSGALTGALYGGVSAGAKEGDIYEALKGAGLGAVLGGVGAPIIERTLSGLTRVAMGGKPVLTPAGDLTDEAMAAARAAGLSDDEIRAIGPHLKQTFEARGVTPGATTEARFAEFGMQPSRGMVTGDPAQLAREKAYGSLAPIAEQAAEAAQRQAGGTGATLSDAVSDAVSRGRQEAAKLQSAYQGAYKAAENVPGSFSRESISNLGERIRGNWGMRGDLNFYSNDLARNTAKKLDETLGAKIPAPGGSVIHRDFRAVEEGRKILNSALGAARDKTDRAAMRKMIEDFDEQIERSIANGAFSGDPKVVDQWKQARKLFSEYQNKYGVRRSGDEAGTLMRQVLDGKSADDVANMMFNFNRGDTTMRRDAVKVFLQLRRALGANAPELEQIKRSYVQQLMTPAASGERLTPKDFVRVSQQIEQTLRGRGASFARAALSPEERASLARYAEVIRIAGSSSPSQLPEKINMLARYAATAAPMVASGASYALSMINPMLALTAGAVGALPGAYSVLKASPAVQSSLARRSPETAGRPYRFPSVRTGLPLATAGAPEISETVPPVVEMFEERQRVAPGDPRELTIRGPGNRPARARGGAVNLHALAKAAKKHVTTSTEQLLNEHDDTVAKALEVANKHI
jgi:hypothetical protein